MCSFFGVPYINCFLNPSFCSLLNTFWTSKSHQHDYSLSEPATTLFVFQARTHHFKLCLLTLYLPVTGTWCSFPILRFLLFNTFVELASTCCKSYHNCRHKNPYGIHFYLQTSVGNSWKISNCAKRDEAMNFAVTAVSLSDKYIPFRFLGVLPSWVGAAQATRPMRHKHKTMSRIVTSEFPHQWAVESLSFC